MTKERFNFIWETAAIFVAIFALWPWLLGWEPRRFWWGVLVGALVLMLVVAYRRIRRLHALREEREDQESLPPFGPLPPLPPQ